MPARRTPQSPTATRTRARANGTAKNGNGATNTNGRRTKRDLDDSTPAKVVDAAIACILEEGFYRASSNEIARRADVTWGVIQYHFGSREALLLAVLERAASHLQATLEAAHISGGSLEDRLSAPADVIWSYYGQAQFLAYIQVMLNLSHDPSTEEQTRQAIRENQLHVSHHLPRVLQE